jgi:ATP-dependent DNA helicase DinG
VSIKREKLINESFTQLGFGPRPGQVELVNDILTQYLDNKKQNVILCGDTGMGKSLIAAVVGECLNVINKGTLAAVYLSSTNALVNQYADSFEKLGDRKFFRIKGASNYKCGYFNKMGNEKATGDDCVRNHLSEAEIAKHCSGCEFKRTRALTNTTEHLITNYAYWMISKLWSTHMKDRSLQVFDEAHLLNDVFCSQMTITVSESTIDLYIKDCNSMNGKGDAQSADLILFKNAVKTGMINKNNYQEYTKKLCKIYSSISEICTFQAALVPDLMAKSRFTKIKSKFDGLVSRIDGFFKHQYEHVFDDTVKGEFSIKPLFINSMMSMLLGEYNLFMTATMSPSFAETTMDLDKNSTAFIEAPQTFSPKSRPILFLGKHNLNFEAMKDPATFVDMSKIISHIVDHHKNEKGIILTPSFYVTKTLASKIPKGTKIFEHTQGTNASDVVREFKKHSGAAVLLSPSIFEGLDFPDDDSRFQIIIKSPYASMGDPRIKKIANEYSEIYREITLYKILQGIGRSIRSPSDFASTYFLDKTSATLFDSKLNLWKSRFDVKT